MRRTFGQFQNDKTEGLLRPVTFPSLARMDETTGDRRELASAGGGVRELPRTIFAQFAQEPGHFGSVPVGTLQEVVLEDDGNISGRGWLADLPIVREQLVTMLATKTLFHNSVDLAEVTYEYVWKSDDPADGIDYWTIEKVLFTSWNIAATTFVGVPAFQDARGILGDEVTAAINGDGPLEWLVDGVTLRIEARDEIMASLAANIDSTVSFDDFHMPEPNVPTSHTVTADDRVFGHLAQWGQCHEGIDGSCVLAPRPRSYHSFNGQAGKVLTDKGLIETGVLFFLGGHPDHPLDTSQTHKAYGGVENGWADIRVVDGRFGPWYCGRVRPGLSDAAKHVARASGVSGHWKRGELQAVVSVNVRGYKIPGTEIRADAGGASFDDDGVVDLVASFRGPEGFRDAEELVAEGLVSPEELRAAVQAEVAKRFSTTFVSMNPDQFMIGDATLGTTIVNINTTSDAAEKAADEGGSVAVDTGPDLLALETQLLLDDLDDDDDR